MTPKSHYEKGIELTIPEQKHEEIYNIKGGWWNKANTYLRVPTQTMKKK